MTTATSGEAAVPSLADFETHRRALTDAMLNAITKDDMQAIVAAQEAKAKDGNAEAAKLVRDWQKLFAARRAMAKAGDAAAAEWLRRFKCGMITDEL